MSHGVERIHEKGMLLTTTGVRAGANGAGNFKVETDFPRWESSAQYKVRRFLNLYLRFFLVRFHVIIGFSSAFIQLQEDARDQFGFWLEV